MTQHSTSGGQAVQQQSLVVLSDASNELVELTTVGCAVGLYDNALLEGQTGAPGSGGGNSRSPTDDRRYALTRSM